MPRVMSHAWFLTIILSVQTGMAAPKMIMSVTSNELTRTPVSPLIYGHFIELGFGRQVEGLWAEMLYNRSFEPIKPYTGIHWYWLQRTPESDLTKEDWWHSGYEEQPWFLAPGNEQAQWQTVEATAFRRGMCGGWLANNDTAKWAGVAQNGVWLRAGERYQFRADLRAPREMWDMGTNDCVIDVEVRLYREGDWDTPLATQRLSAITSDYQPFACEVNNIAYTGRATFSIWIPPQSHLNVDDCSLMPASNMRGWRAEAIALARQMKPRIVRWPGGCFASFYNWRHGIGPREERHPEPSVFWGGLNDNDVGTPEFADFCRMVDAQPLVCVNMMTATAQDAADWVAYCNAPADNPLGALRAHHGSVEPYDVILWELDNETFRKCGPREYAQRCVAFSRAMKAVDPRVQTVMVAYGPYHVRLKDMLAIAGRDIDYITDRATDEAALRADLAVLEEYNRAHGMSVKLCNTEWLAQMSDVPVKPDDYNVQPHSPENTMQNRQIRWRYAMNAANTLLMFQRLGGEFAWANFNNFANTWGQNVLECPKERVFLSAAGRVFELFSDCGAVWPLASTMTPASAEVIGQAAWDSEWRTLVILVLNYRHESVVMNCRLNELERRFIDAEICSLSADSLAAHNALANPHAITRNEQRSAVAADNAIETTLPPFSVTRIMCR